MTVIVLKMETFSSAFLKSFSQTHLIQLLKTIPVYTDPQKLLKTKKKKNVDNKKNKPTKNVLFMPGQ